MRNILAIATSVALVAIPTAAFAARGPLTQACPAGTPFVVCVCTANPNLCYPGTFVLRPR